MKVLAPPVGPSVRETAHIKHSWSRLATTHREMLSSLSFSIRGQIGRQKMTDFCRFCVKQRGEGLG